jgi:glycosyltransferase involved in cell wall biosynthesis
MRDKNYSFVVIFGPEIWPLQEYGGVSRYCYELISNLSALGTNVRVLLGPNRNPYKDMFDPKLLVELADNSPSEVSRGITHALENYDVGIYHATYFDSANLEVAFRKGLKTIVTVHDLIGDLFPEKIRWFQRRNRAQEYVANRCDLIITDSENTKSDLETIYKISPVKIRVVHLGAGTLKKSANPVPPTFTPYVLHVGNRNGYKNFNLTVEAISKSTRLKKLQIAAFGGGDFTTGERRKFAETGMGSRIVHLSGTDESLENLYRNAVALVYPSLYEGFGIPPLEAMRLHCPVIASDRASISEVCGSDVFYINPESITSLQEKLIQLIENPESYDSERAHAHSLQFTWENTASKTLSIYSELIDRKS